MRGFFNSYILRPIEYISKPVFFGVLSVVLFFIAAAGMYATSLGWWGNGDTVMHVDYVWQVSQGTLPSFAESIQYEPYNDIRPHKVQSAAHHPPLYYLLVSPFMVGFLEAGQWEKAVATGRVINIMLGSLTILALAWSGWLMGGKRRRLFAVLVPALAASFPTLIKTGGDVTPDMLTLLLSILVFVLSYKTLKYGASKKRTTSLVIVSILGMLTKVTFLPALLVAMCTLGLSSLVKGSSFSFSRRRVIKGLFLASLLLLLVIASSGWFYYGHNYEASGSFTRAGSQEWISDSREYKSLGDVLGSKNLVGASMQVALSLFYDARIAVSSILIVLAVGWFYMKYKNTVFKISNMPEKIIIALFILHYIALFVGQVGHAEGYGQISSRYFLTGILFSSLVYAYGSAVNRVLPAIAVFVLSVLNILALYYSHVRWLVEKVSPAKYGGLEPWARVIRSASENWIPQIVPYTLSLTLLISFVTMVLIVGVVSNSKHRTQRVTQ